MKKASNRLKNSDSSLQKSEFRELKEDGDLYKQMFEHSVLPIIIHDLEMNIIDINNKTLEEFGYSKEELFELKVFDLHPDTELEHSEEVLARMKSTKNRLSVETKFRRKDGTIFNAEATPTKYILGDRALIHVSIKDITQRKKDELRIVKALEKARESDLLKSTFLANISHEIRTPMTGIIGFASFLKNNQVSGDIVKKYAEIITEKGEQLLAIIGNIIDISKYETGQLEISNSNFNVNNLLQEVYDHFTSKLLSKNKKNIALEMNIPPREIFVISDPSRVRQILMNLVGNAIKFTEKGKVEFGCNLENTSLIFYVKDTGIGIPEDRKKWIFERFHQATNSTELYEGTGLGLAIAKAYTKLLGGEIWFESEENVGSTFYFSIKYLTENGS